MGGRSPLLCTLLCEAQPHLISCPPPPSMSPLHPSLAPRTFSPPRLCVQLGGSDPETLAAAVKKVVEYGYDEINLNCGCPRCGGCGVVWG